jgi:hypothetical protein
MPMGSLSEVVGGKGTGCGVVVVVVAGCLLGWWRHFSQLDVCQNFNHTFFGWVILGAIVNAHRPCAFFGCYAGRLSTGEGAGWLRSVGRTKNENEKHSLLF